MEALRFALPGFMHMWGAFYKSHLQRVGVEVGQRDGVCGRDPPA